jgi:predicted O-methyltransferase YrrM
MEFLPPDLDAYVEAHTRAESDVLNELNRETWQKVLQPRMLSGHLQGRVLSMLSKMIQPKAILEIGTYTGYSAICLAEGLPEHGFIDTIDINDELEPMVSRFIEASGNKNRIKTHFGNAMEIIPNLKTQYDLVFIDADKTNYLNYYNLVFEQLPVGAYIIADNVLWSGKVLDEDEKQNDADTAAIHEYNETIQSDDRVENVLFPIRDGLMVCRKIRA